MNEMPDRQDALNAFAAKFLMPEPKPNGHAGGEDRTGYVPTDEQVLAAARKAKNAAKFADLYDAGDVHAHHGGDDSVADYALLGILKYYTQDPDQLERLMHRSALARAKWDERRGGRTWLRFSIDNALEDAGERYEWGKERRRSFSSSSGRPRGSESDENNEDPRPEPEIVWLSELGEPKEREYLIERIGVKGYPIVAFGAGGVAKSFAMLAAGVAIASASGVDKWLGLRVCEHGHVLYLDFELDVDEQHRRVRDVCNGLGVLVPKRLAYLSGVGVSTEAAFRTARKFVKDYGALAVIIDSMGLAMEGDMERGKDVLAFHRHYTDPLRRIGATPFIVDHEGKLQTGEKHKDKSPFGSAYKAWAARSVLQFQLEEYDKEASALDIRVRQTKTNFGSPLEPFGVRLTFSEKKVSIDTFKLPDTEVMEEEALPVRERILGALRAEPQTVPDLEKLTGAATGTIYNNLAQLVQAEEVVEDGYRGRKKLYRLFSSSPGHPRGDDDDENEKTPGQRIMSMLGRPPAWLANQLKLCCEDPDRLVPPTCRTIASEVYGDHDRWEEVKPILEAHLADEDA